MGGKGGGAPSLVEVNEKHHVVSEAGQPVGRRHGNDKCENVVDEGVESLMVEDKMSEATVLRSSCLDQTMCL